MKTDIGVNNMLLLDYFAAKIIQSLCTDDFWVDRPKEAVTKAYKIAYLMIEERGEVI